ncbi:alpha/beta fold hydrolase [Streptomyces sp. ICN988]|uniref:thioesterase II family protein n=1 Tax=unclassified Streptomyces TaxID=2593676 RepID=UPI0021E4C5EE|nr:alpha/beta fold hydrolase [Streptomyces sp. ICN988]MCV2458645.1 alpha/beta fold hydrolase [Streptomyces sp. ICN988]
MTSAPQRAAYFSRPWVWDLRPTPGPHTAALLLLPHGGGSAHAFTEWPTHFPDDVTVLAAQYPGRGSRFGEPPARSMEELRDALVDALDALDLPLVIFGNSLGALLGFEVAWCLEQAGRPPAALCVSGAWAPHAREPGATYGDALWSDAALVDWLHEYGGMPAQVLADPDLLTLVLDAVRADLTIVENYRFGPAPRRLACPITVLGGTEDRLVSERTLRAWRERTRRDAEVHLLPGDHFHFADHLPYVTGLVRAHLPTPADPSGKRAEHDRT